MEEYGILTIVVFVASWNDSSRGRGVTVARIPTTADKAQDVYLAWTSHNGHIGARASSQSPYEATFRANPKPVYFS